MRRTPSPHVLARRRSPAQRCRSHWRRSTCGRLSLVSVAVLFRVLDEAKPSRAALLGWAFGVGKYGVGASWIYVSIHDYGPAPVWLAGSLVALFVVAMAWFPGGVHVRVRALGARAESLGERDRLQRVLGRARVDVDVVPDRIPMAVPRLRATRQSAAPLGARWRCAARQSRCRAQRNDCGRRDRAACDASRPDDRGIGVRCCRGSSVSASATSRWVEPGRRAPSRSCRATFRRTSNGGRRASRRFSIGTGTLSEPYWQRDLVIWPEAAVTLFEQQAAPFIEAMACAREQQAARRWCSVCRDTNACRTAAWRFATWRRSSATVGPLHQAPARAVRRIRSARRSVARRDRVLRSADVARRVRVRVDNRCCRPDTGRLAMAICYEIVYPDLVRRDARDADVIVTISNDSWFGRSIGPHQHLQMVRMRALENGRYVLRATNNGMTAIVDADRGGRSRRRRSSNRWCSTARFSGMSGVTPYARVSATFRCSAVARVRHRSSAASSPARLTAAPASAPPAALSFEGQLD